MFLTLTSCTKCLKKDQKIHLDLWIHKSQCIFGLFNKFYADKNHHLCQINLYFWILMLINITFYSSCKHFMKTTEVCMYSPFYNVFIVIPIFFSVTVCRRLLQIPHHAVLWKRYCDFPSLTGSKSYHIR